ncbi:MAG: ribosome maturation factor RimM [Bacteroidota bacterium]
MDKLVIVGRIGKPHGIKGYIVLHLLEDIDWENIHSLFIEMDNVPVPYLIEDVQFLNQKEIIKLKFIDDVNQAKKMVNKNILVEEKFILSDEEIDIIGFTVKDINKNNFEIGIVEDVISNRDLEWLLIRNSTKKEILLPLNDDLLESIDEENKIIFYKAIDGMY